MPKPSIKFAIIAAAGVAVLTGSAFAGTTNIVPYSENFENFTNGTPLINGTNGWYGSSYIINGTNWVCRVQTNTVRTGTNAAMIPDDCTLSNLFVPTNSANVWIEMDVSSKLYDGPANPSVDVSQAGVFYVNSAGNFVVHNGPTANPDSSAGWVVTTNGGIGTSGTNWVRICIYADFANAQWDLYADGTLVTNSIGFVNTGLTNLLDFGIYNGLNTSYMDNVHITAPGTLTVAPTSLAFQVMRGVTSNQIVTVTAQTGFWSFTNTISADATNWLGVNPVTGTVNATWTNLVVGCGIQSNGSYTGILTVSATNSDGFPQTRTVTVSLDVMDLQVTPVSPALTNGFMYSNSLAIPPQTFSVSNAGGGAFNYTVQPQGDATNWLSLSISNGVAGATNISVFYPIGLLPRAYSGEVWVVTTNGGGATSRVSVAVTVVARPVLELAPLIMTQTVAKGVNPVNQEFTIWNGSMTPKVPMAYTLSMTNGSPELIKTLSSFGGVITGQIDGVSVTYMDDIGGSIGVHTACVYITAWDPGDRDNTYAPTGTVWLSTTMVVRVTVTGLDAPSGVTASDGMFTNQVAVSWNPVAGAVNYKVYRSATFDWTQAEPIGESVETIFYDLTGQAGMLYYYWLSSVNMYRGEGLLSTNRETGYRGLAAPGGIFATDGAYTNKVRVTWPEVDGATGYQLYRGFPGGALAPIYFTPKGLYWDIDVAPGTKYEYRVEATNGMFGSALSMGETGYAFGAPGGLTASKGTYVGMVRVTWNAVDSASEYEVWRSTRAVLPPTGGALKMDTVTVPSFDDDSVSAGVRYYYWVRGNGLDLESGPGGWSQMDRGYGAEAGIDLWVKDLVVLPVQVGLGSSPVIVSFRMGNGGGANMAGANGTVGMEFFASTNQVLGAGNEISIGKVVGEVTLDAGQDMVMKVAGNQLVAPTTEGDYNIFVRVLPEPPSLLADTNPDNNVAERNGSMRVRSSGGLNYQVFNDYDGDGMSDLGVYRGQEWSIRSLDWRVLAEGVTVFSGSGRPVLGDLDGDRRSDPMVHDSGSGVWQVLYSGSGYRWASGVFGVSGYRGLVADYEGVGHGNASVFHEGNGRWYVLRSDGGLTVWNWGEDGYVPVIGDYDGDGRWDMAVYQETTGLWYIRTINDQLLVTGSTWGGPGCIPVPGDYDGDGCWDAAIYAQASGQWYIGALDGRILAWGTAWGGLGYEPVMGDYDGDGKWDLGVYQEATGLWYIRTLEGSTLAWASPWGGAGYRPIGN